MAQNMDKWFNADITQVVESSNGKMELFSNGNCTGTSSTQGELEYIEFR